MLTVCNSALTNTRQLPRCIFILRRWSASNPTLRRHDNFNKRRTKEQEAHDILLPANDKNLTSKSKFQLRTQNFQEKLCTPAVKQMLQEHNATFHYSVTTLGASIIRTVSLTVLNPKRETRTHSDT